MKNETLNIPQSFIEDFKSRCEAMPNGCVSYVGAHTVRLPADLAAEVRFVSPRRAAWIIKNKQIPDREIKLICHTSTCVNPEHFIEGRERRTHGTEINAKLIKKIQSETISHRAIAKKYQLSRNTVSKIFRDETS